MTKPAISVTAARVARLGSAGIVTVSVRCPWSEVSCAGLVILRAANARVGRAAYRTVGGRAARVRVRLSAAGRALVKRRGRVRVRAAVSARDAAGNRATRARTFTLAAPR